MIVTGPAEGFGPLLHSGLTPIFMRPWSDLDAKRAAQRWAQTWPQIGKKRRKAAVPNADTVERAHTNARALTAIEVTLKIWATYAQDTEALGVEGWMRAYIKRRVENAGDLMIQMGQIAALQLDEGFVSSARLQALAITGEGARQAPAAAPPPVEESLLQASDFVDGGEAAPEEAKSTKDTETTSSQGRLLGMLRRSGILVRFRDDRYLFRRGPIAAYLASLTLQDATPEVLSEKAALPAWSQAIAYSALNRPLDTLVMDRMRAAPDLLQEAVLGMARWLAYASADVEWRGPMLNHLGNMLIAPSQYPLMRERVAAALIDTRDKNVLLMFRKAARNIDADIRRLACLGMGAVGDGDGLRDLTPLLRDQDPNVELAAGMALGAIGTEDALRPMVQMSTGGSEQLRQTMAEAFAALPEEGYPTLYDAVTEEDFMVRRAAIFGLRRLNTTWALVAIYRAFLEDEQWYVRSAAQQAFQELTYGRTTPDRSVSECRRNPLAASLGSTARRNHSAGGWRSSDAAEGTSGRRAPSTHAGSTEPGTAWHGGYDARALRLAAGWARRSPRDRASCAGRTAIAARSAPALAAVEIERKTTCQVISFAACTMTKSIQVWQSFPKSPNGWQAKGCVSGSRRSRVRSTSSARSAGRIMVCWWMTNWQRSSR